VNHFLQCIRHKFFFHSFFWMIGELVRTSPWRLLITLDGPEFDNFGGGENSMEVLVGVSS
jgi:hypothetical protein